MKKFSIALDGPSGSGKSTIAKALSSKLNILYLDTGAMYRATAVKALKLGIDSFDEEGVKTFIDNIDLEIKYIDGTQHTFLDGEDVSQKIREPHVSMLASNISSLKCVRLKMVDMQRKIADTMSCVLDGRDIGSFVLPNADYKFYITASVDVRADRRFKELTLKGHSVDFNQLKAEIEPENTTYKDIEWSVSEEGIASIDENGVLTANATGIVIVTAEAKSGVTETIEIEVYSNAGDAAAGIIGIAAIGGGGAAWYYRRKKKKEAEAE